MPARQTDKKTTEKMKKFLFFALLAVILQACPLFAANSNDTIITKELLLKSDFNTIETFAGVTLKYTPLPAGQKAKAILKVTKSLKDSAVVTIEGNTLRFGIKGKNNISYSVNSLGELFSLIKNGFKTVRSRGSHAVLYLSAPAVATIDASSASTVTVTDYFLTDGNLTLKSSSGANIRFHSLKCRKLDADASSGADIDIDHFSGECIYADASSGADIDIKAIDAKGTVTASASSGADIDLSGRAATADFSASSGADIDGRQLTVATARLDASSGADVKVTATEGATKNTSSGGSAKRYR